MSKQKKPGRIPFWRQPRFRYGSMSTALLCLCLAVLVGVNVLFDTLEKKNGWRVDYSFNGVTTQSETTRAVLDSLPHDVHIYVLYTQENADLPLLELLNRYAAASDRVTWEHADVTLNPALLTRFPGTADEPLTNDSLVVSCEATGRYKILTWENFISLGLNYETGAYAISGLTYEQQITSAISYVTQETIPRVMILQGHGELDEGSTAVLADFLTSNNFEVAYFELGSAEAELRPDDLLMILSPQRDFMDTELKALMDFASAGGNILFTCDYTDPVENMPNYQALLRSYGIQPRDGVVVASTEESGTYYDNMQIALLPYMQRSAATMQLVENHEDTLLMIGARAFAQPEEADNNLIVQTVLTSGYKAYLRDLRQGSMDLQQQDGDPVGPFPLALLSQRVTETGHVSKAFALGASSTLTSSQVYVMTDAQAFILTLCTYLSGAKPVQLDIMAKTALRPALSTDSLAPGIALVVAVPLTVVAIALLVLLPRRHR